jgi:TonB-dependent SusC/RagA subfamily outer membrane receptor
MVRKIVLSLVAVLAMSVAAFAQNVRVSGVVVDETNKPVVGATVFVDGSNVGVNSGLDGSFIIEAPKNAALNVSFIGYESQKIQLGAQTHYRIVMKEDALAIESVSVIGYGSVNKVGSITGSISKVDGDLLKNKPTTNVADAMQGQVAGLEVYTSSGEPTQTSSIRLHGVGSLEASATPLVLLDGAPISVGTMNMLNPNDIESVNILKDASATSVYGSRAANGVIYITTKRGARDREATITFNAQYGISAPANDTYNMMSGPELIEYQRKWGVFPDATCTMLAEMGNDTNWREYFYDYSAPMYQVDMSVSGGSKKTSYYVSGMFMDQQGTDYASGVHT